MLGWLGSILLGCCGFPETIRTIKDGRCHVSWGMLTMWYFGEIFVLIHIFNSSRDASLIFNYIFNCILLTIMVYYKGKESI